MEHTGGIEMVNKALGCMPRMSKAEDEMCHEVSKGNLLEVKSWGDRRHYHLEACGEDEISSVAENLKAESKQQLAEI